MVTLETPPTLVPARGAAGWEVWHWLGPLGRYRPGLLRKDLTRGFRNCDARSWPRWARLPLFVSPEERLLLKLPLQGKVVYDVGAHTGAYTLFFSRQVGASGAVVAFEPHPRSHAILRRNLACNRIGNARALRYALGAASGSRPLYALPGMSTTASLAPEASTPLRRCVGAVEMEPLDRLVGRLQLPPPSFIKIDVEGMELDVLRGASDTLQRCRPDLLIEVHGASHRHKSECIRQVALLLAPWGYRLLHAETGAAVTAANARLGSGHLWASVAA